LCFAAKLAERGTQLSSDYVKSGAASIEGRAERRPNRKGSRVEMSARPGGGGGSGKGFFWYGFIYLMEAVPVPGGGSFATVSERSEHR